MDQLPCTSFFGRNMAQRWTGAHILSLNIWLLDFFETLRWFCSSGPKPQSVSQALQELHADTSDERSTCWAVLVIQGESTVFNAVQPKTLQWCLYMFPHVSSMNLEASGPFGPCKPKWLNDESTSKPKGPHLCILDVAGVVVTASAQQDEIWQVMKWYEMHLTSFNLSHDKLRVTKRNGKCPMRRSGRAKSSPKGQLKDAEKCWKIFGAFRLFMSLLSERPGQ